MVYALAVCKDLKSRWAWQCFFGKRSRRIWVASVESTASGKQHPCTLSFGGKLCHPLRVKSHSSIVCRVQCSCTREICGGIIGWILHQEYKASLISHPVSMLILYCKELEGQGEQLMLIVLRTTGRTCKENGGFKKVHFECSRCTTVPWTEWGDWYSQWFNSPTLVICSCISASSLKAATQLKQRWCGQPPWCWWCVIVVVPPDASWLWQHQPWCWQSQPCCCWYLRRLCPCHAGIVRSQQSLSP